VKSYVVIDDQSNSSLAKSKLLDRLNVHGQTTTYSLKTCAGIKPDPWKMQQISHCGIVGR
jgi:hypothetical protein